MLRSFKTWLDEIIKHIVMPYSIITPAIHVKRNKRKMPASFSHSAHEVSVSSTFFLLLFFFNRTCNNLSLL